ncbi:MAG: phosphotransferase, partial [Microbacterium sp.]
MSIPLEPVAVPAPVQALAAGAALTPVWRNNLGGLTFRASGAGGDRYIKWAPRGDESSLADEVTRVRWAGPFLRVPEVIEYGGDDTHEWLVTAALPGQSAVAPRWVADAATAVRAVGEGLRAMHDRLPVLDCPFEWSVASRTENAAGRGIRVPDALREPPPIDRLVVCHGDAC